VNACVHTYTKPQTSSTRSRGLGRRIHGSVEDTKLSTNKQLSLSFSVVGRMRQHRQLYLILIGHDKHWVLLGLPSAFPVFDVASHDTVRGGRQQLGVGVGNNWARLSGVRFE